METNNGNAIAAERERMGMRVNDLAANMGVCRETVVMWETGEESPNSSQLVELSHLFGCTTDRLLGIEGACGVKAIEKSHAPAFNDIEQISYAATGLFNLLVVLESSGSMIEPDAMRPLADYAESIAESADYLFRKQTDAD